MPSPEELAREKIDPLLQQCGWILQNRTTINLSASRGVAIREALLQRRDEVDYLLFVDGKAIGTVEAKPEGFTLTGVEEQSGKYGKGLLDIYPKWREPLPFAYESTGVETQFTNQLDPTPKSRNVFAFHRSETLLEYLEPDHQLNHRLANLLTSDQMPKSNLWSAQIEAIRNLEKSLAAGWLDFTDRVNDLDDLDVFVGRSIARFFEKHPPQQAFGVGLWALLTPVALLVFVILL